jgi:hypothetical protein
MRNKRLVYVLLPLTLGIWAVIIVKVIRSVNPGGEVHQLASDKLFDEVTAFQVDTFSLYADYEDPFLEAKPKRPVSAGAKTARKAHIRPKAAKPWPSLHY